MTKGSHKRASGEDPFAKAWQQLRGNRAAMTGLVILIIIAGTCMTAPWLAPYDPTEQNLALGPQPPSREHWLGTDTLGRDLLSRILYGGRISFMVGFLATAVAIGVGVIYGAVSGYFGGRVDRLMMRMVEIIYAMPFTIFVILLMVVFGRHLWLIFIAIGAVEWLTMSRIIRGQVMHLRTQAFVEAARALGQNGCGIFRRHLLPNLWGIIIVYATLTVPGVMLLEAFISFLGLGVQPPDTSWGDLIREGAEGMEAYPWTLIFPSLFFALTLFSLNFLGDGLRDALDPRSAQH